VERHRLALPRLARLAGRSLAFLRDRRELALPGLVRRLRVEALRHGLDARSDLLDVDQHVGDLGAAAQLLFGANGMEPAFEKALLTGGVLGEAARDAVVIGEDQPFGRYERSGAVGQPDRAEADALEPRVVDRDAVLALEPRGRERVERPHAFVGEHRYARGGCGGEQRGADGRADGSSGAIVHGRPRPVCLRTSDYARRAGPPAPVSAPVLRTPGAAQGTAAKERVGIGAKYRRHARRRATDREERPAARGERGRALRR